MHSMSPQMAYDRAITVFSPDGRLFQVEYAREAVKRGTTAIGVRGKEGVVLIVDKRISSRLLVASSVEKIFQIDEHIGVATSGLVADARNLVDRARVDAQVNRMWYDEPIGVETLAKKVCDHKQAYTQYGAVRPFGTALLIAGLNSNESSSLFETDPSGALLEYRATGIGAGRPALMEVFEEKYDENLSIDETVLLGLEALSKAIEGNLNAEVIEVGAIEVKTGKFRRFGAEELNSFVSIAMERQPSEKKSEDKQEK